MAKAMIMQMYIVMQRRRGGRCTRQRIGDDIAGINGNS